ncbi:hypothetical protein [Bradyrhizobium sp. WSM2254]|nr:hypothetical protein [Bradyrhizobium sp. WSM2254]
MKIVAAVLPKETSIIQKWSYVALAMDAEHRFRLDNRLPQYSRDETSRFA